MSGAAVDDATKLEKIKKPKRKTRAQKKLTGFSMLKKIAKERTGLSGYTQEAKEINNGAIVALRGDVLDFVMKMKDNPAATITVERAYCGCLSHLISTLGYTKAMELLPELSAALKDTSDKIDELLPKKANKQKK